MAIKQYSKEELLEAIYRDIDSVEPAYQERMFRRNECFDFIFGRHRTQEELDKLEQQGRNNIIFNEIQAKFNHLVGSQTQLRMDVVVKGREKADDAFANILTQVVRWVEQVCDMDQVETKTFIELAGAGYAVGCVRWHRDTDGYGYPIVEKIPSNEMRWDGNAKKDDYSDAKWQARLIEMTRQQAIELFPEYEEEIMLAGVSLNNNDGQTVGRYHNIKSATQELLQDTNTTIYSSNPLRELIMVIEHYEARYVPEYLAINGIKAEVTKFDNKKDCQDYIDGLTEEYIKQGKILLDENGHLLVKMDVFNKKRIFQSIVIGDSVVCTDEIALPEFPYIIATGYFDEGYAIGFVDNLISPQKFYNDQLTMLDYIMGTNAKNITTVMQHLLHQDYKDVEVLQDELSKTGGMILVQSHNAIQTLPMQQPAPALYTNMNQAAQFMVSSVGGMNALGQQENAAESGRAIEMRAQAGGTGRLPLFDSLKKWRKNVAMRMVWWIKNYMTPEQVIRVTGLEGTPYADIPDNVLNTMSEIMTDVVIDETNKSSTVRAAQFTQLQQLFIQNNVPSDISLPMLLEYSDLPEAKKQEIKANNQIYQEMQQKQAEIAQHQKVQGEATRELEKRVLKEQLKQKEEYQTRKDVEELSKQKQQDEAEMLQQEMEKMSPEELSNLIV